MPKRSSKKLNGAPAVPALKVFVAIAARLMNEPGELMKTVVKQLEEPISEGWASDALKSVEEYYGFDKGELVERGTHRGCRLTGPGEAIYQRLKEAIAAYEVLISPTVPSGQETITVATGPAVAVHAIPRIVSNFRKLDDQPRADTSRVTGARTTRAVNFIVRTFGDKFPPIDAVANGNASIAVTIGKVAEELESIEEERTSFKVEEVLLLPRRVRGTIDAFKLLREQEEVALADLARFPVCFTEYPNYHLNKFARERAGLTDGNRVRVGTIEEVAAFVATGQYVGIAASWLTAYGRWENTFELKPLRSKAPYRVATYVRTSPRPSANLLAFRTCVKEFFDEIAVKEVGAFQTESTPRA